MQIVELDVRPVLREGGEPFPLIMQTVSGLQEGQSLRLLATFRPVPLFQVMERKGFSCAAREITGGDWEVIFSPAISEATAEEIKPVSLSARTVVPEIWPDPMHYLDYSLPDQKIVTDEILHLLGSIEEGAVVFVLFSAEPRFLLSELENAGHQWVGNFDASGEAYRMMIRSGAH
ncbi:DUF2249 domain-containing protein [Ochrobactrum sp. GRS2]|nr:DUF2249 domain-containing protein [Ochrobactrum sp. GRS2]